MNICQYMYIYIYIYMYIYVYANIIHASIYIQSIYPAIDRLSIDRSMIYLSIDRSIYPAVYLYIYRCKKCIQPENTLAFSNCGDFFTSTFTLLHYNNRNTQQHTAAHCKTKILKSSVRLRERAKESVREN